jgi:hypothetical protein
MNKREKIVNIKFAALAAALLLTAGCGTMNGPTHPPEQTDDSVGNTSTSEGSSAVGTQQSGRPAGRTRAEVRAEAVEAVKNHKSTLQEERDFFNPYAH